MIQYLLGESNPLVAALGLLTAFAATCFLLTKLSGYLPKDAGREFAHDGKLSAGKPRGAGIIFILVFTAAALIFAPMNREMCIYLILVAAEMLTGYMDDASEHPWNEYKKGLLDLIVAGVLAMTYLNFNSSTIDIAILGIQVTIPPVLFGILTVILVWTSINVTNCADGVDGLSGTLALITLMTVYVIDNIRGTAGSFSYLILLFGICILGYLWYNATPSRLVKVALLRFLKIHILKNTRTPLHDHVRKIMGWSNTQTVFRFAIVQIVVSFVTVYLLLARQ